MSDDPATARIHLSPDKRNAAPMDDSGGTPDTLRIDVSSETDSPPTPFSDGSAELSSQYTIEEKIGDGGMGVVYLGRDRRLGRYVAIKRLHRSCLLRPELRKRFFREAKAIAALNHVHIVHVYAMSEDSDGPYIVMEYVSGPPASAPNKVPPPPFDLADRVNRDGPLPAAEALELLLKISGAIEYAHSCGVIHRDLKPTNILISETGEPKIVDFGLARVPGSEGETLTVPGERMLSMGYGAPEQESDASRTDERADVYGLGALMYFGITGKNPRYFRPDDVPESLRMPIVKALETDREKRWASAREFTAALLLVKAPSTVALPTAKSTWRCKWCDTVNPVAIQYCGRCGWDGGVSCPECGAPMRVGVPFCGDCGADARVYEEALMLHQRLEQHCRNKAYELVVEQADRISGFRPIGARGRRLVEDIHRYREEAKRALARRRQLRETIPQEIAEELFEAATQHIREYNALSADRPFADERDRLPGLRLKRDQARVYRALGNRQWAEAARLCQEILREIAPEDAETKRLLRKIRQDAAWTRVRNLTALALLLVLLYVLSAAPAVRLLGGPPLGSIAFYRPLTLVQNATFLDEPLERYAALWAVPGLYAAPRADQSPPAGAAAASSVANRMDELQTEYDAVLHAIQSEYRVNLKRWPAEYESALTAHREKVQQAGDFEAWLAVEEEIGRFDASGELTEDDLAHGRPGLREIQEDFLRRRSSYGIDRSRKILDAARQYAGRLRQMLKELTMAGRMGDAAAVNGEIKRLSASPPVANSEAYLASSDSPEEDARAATAEPAAP